MCFQWDGAYRPTDGDENSWSPKTDFLELKVFVSLAGVGNRCPSAGYLLMAVVIRFPLSGAVELSNKERFPCGAGHPE